MRNKRRARKAEAGKQKSREKQKAKKLGKQKSRGKHKSGEAETGKETEKQKSRKSKKQRSKESEKRRSKEAEKQENAEQQRSRPAGKSGEAKKLGKAEKLGTRNQKIPKRKTIPKKIASHNCQSTNRHYQLPIVSQPALIRVCSTWPRTTSSMAEGSWSEIDIAETSRKAAGWNQTSLHPTKKMQNPAKMSQTWNFRVPRIHHPSCMM